jgi:osmotically-inducible protein OsmY
MQALMGTDLDSAIADAAVNALMWYRAVAPGAVTVIVTDGWLTLTGVVADLQQRGAAERAVLGLRGVRGVSNALRVVRAPCAMPHALTS